MIPAFTRYRSSAPPLAYYDMLAADGATHLWKMGAAFGSGGELDAIGSYDLTNNATAPTLGAALNAVNTGGLNFASTYLSKAAPSDLYAAGAFSLEFWGKWTDGTNAVVMEINGNSGFSLQISNGSGSPTIGVQLAVGGSAGVTKTNMTLNNGVARHFVLVSNGASSKIYVNGADSTYAAAALTPSYGSAALYFGSRAGIGPVTGEFSDFAFFPSALTAAQALAHYNAGH